MVLTIVIAAPVSNRASRVSGRAGREFKNLVESKYPSVRVVFIPDDQCIHDRAGVIQKYKDAGPVFLTYWGHGVSKKICLSPDTPIITASGIKRIDRIVKGSSVLTHTGNFRRVTKVYKRDYTGEMIEITPFITNSSLRVTPEHPVLAVQCPRCETYPSRFCCPTCTYLGKTCNHPISSGPSWIPAADLNVRDVVMYPRCRKRVDKKDFRISDVVKLNLAPQKIYERIMKLRSQGFGNWRIAAKLKLPSKTGADPYIYRGVKPEPRLEDGKIVTSGGPTAHLLTNDIAVDKDFMRLAGYYLSEGHASRNDVGFSFGMHETDYVDETRALIESKFNLPTSITGHETVAVVRVSSKYLALFFKKVLGTGAKDKTIPEWIMYADPELQKQFIETLYRGDGQTKFDNRVRIRYVSASKKLVDCLQIMLSNLGIVCGSTFGEYTTPTGKLSGSYYLEVSSRSYPDFKKMFNIPIPNEYRRGIGWSDSNYVYRPIKHINTVKYTGSVYNLEVDVDNSYVANFITVHNCGSIPPHCSNTPHGMFDPDNVGLLKDVITYACACWTSHTLGRMAEEIGGKAYVGYRKPLFVGFDMPEHAYARDAINIWQTFPLEMLAGNTVAGAIAEMGSKSRECENFYEETLGDLEYADYYLKRFRSNRDALVPFGDLRATLEI